MILPIVAYGTPVLRSVAKEITPDYPNLNKFIADMWETLYASSGVGLAAPQVNKNIRLFVVDSIQLFANQEEEDKGKYPDEPGFRKIFINAKIKELNGEPWSYNEGCLSIPKIREDILRKEIINITFLDESFLERTMTFNGITARVILHEYDHIDGKLFIDYLKPLKRNLLKRKLDNITKGNVSVDYKMSFSK